MTADLPTVIIEPGITGSCTLRSDANLHDLITMFLTHIATLW